MSKAAQIAAVIAGLGALATAAAWTAQADAAGSNSDVACEIALRHVAGGVELTGLAWARKPTSVSYNLTITAAGGGGRSDIVQSGDVKVGAGGQTELGTASLAVDGDTVYTAVLKIRWKGGSAICRRVTTSAI